MIRIQHSLFLALSMALPACGPTSPDVAERQHAGDSATPAAPTNRVAIPATVRQNLGITFASVEVRHVAQTIRIPGAFELQPRARREYRMALPGRVELLVDQFEQVEPGTPLFRYQSPAWPELLHEVILGEQAIVTAQAAIKVGRATLREARNRLSLARERIAALAQADFKKADLEVEASNLQASLPRLEAEVELAETRLANAERTRSHALHRAATASGIPETELRSEVPSTAAGGRPVPKYLTIDWIEVRAVEPGVVEALGITDGAFVEAPSTVLSTVDPKMLRFRAIALQADLSRISNAAEARIVPPPTPGLPIDRGVSATATLGLEAHPEERTVALIATPDATADWTRPGISAFLEIVAESTAGPSLAVPRSAIVQDGLTHIVFRRDPSNPNQAIRIEADMGVSDGLWVELKSGVVRGDEVVLSGAYELKLATQQSGAPQKGGHFHADGSFHADH